MTPLDRDFLEKISSMTPLALINDKKVPFETVKTLDESIVSDRDIEDAELRLLRFAPFIKKVFPETAEQNGLIESPLCPIKNMAKGLEGKYCEKIFGKVFLKLDSHLKVCGSVKARGGFYEVLKHAEDIVLKSELLTENDNYEKFADKEIRELLSNYTVQVGSTGNLGMSIGIMSAALGFKVIIHMSSDAKQWKKDLLRSRGVTVIEYSDDYSFAVSQGRKNSESDEKSYFVDDERSKDLFLGYAVAASRLKKQLENENISVSEERPLFVYIPAGVGGAPGGISYGLKRIFGDNVHCFFVEPVKYPSVLLGIATELHEKANVRDFGIDTSICAADGLACASPSGFVTRIMTNHLSGSFTVCDKTLFDYLRLLNSTENIKIEPSACAGFEGLSGLFRYEECGEYLKNNNIDKNALENSVHIMWATGGALVPETTFEEYLNTYAEE